MQALSLLLFLGQIAFSHAYPAPIRWKSDNGINFWKIPAKSLSYINDAFGGSTKKYFHEASFHTHYDGRFADTELDGPERNRALRSLFQSYIATMNDVGAQTWIMHGSLMGWWWNRKIMPWDTDLDVQMSEASIDYLAKNYNMTLHHYRYKDGRAGGKVFLLDINPNYIISSTSDRYNVIDARWVDTDTGLFIDITTVRKSSAARMAGHPEYLVCKDRHTYKQNDIFPLRDSTFEGVPVKVPYASAALLTQEYGKHSLTLNVFEDHKFDEVSREWVPISYPTALDVL